MPPIEEPTLGEVLRRIDALTQQVTNLVAELKDDRLAAERTYMRQDVYLRERQAIEQNISDVRSDITTVSERTDARFTRLEEKQQAAGDRIRQTGFALATLLLGVLGLIATIVIAIVKG